MRKIIRTSRAPVPSGHYEQAVASGNLVFLAGQRPLYPATGKAIGGRIEERVRRTLQNIDAVLRAAGTDKRHVMKCGVFLENLGDFGAMNRVYAEFFGPNPPARTKVQAALGGIGVEIDAITVKPRQRKAKGG